ncbi:uncharacterized protein LOC134248360 [Saccostrea cucullata]|uniref:uncharacterized protein LOC134248360 n=1 Tax=Saccostrea cuccullata TaxID=36930 RepID=UPI002ED0DB3B
MYRQTWSYRMPSPFYLPQLPTDYVPYLRHLIKKDRLDKTEEVVRILYKDITFAVFRGSLQRENVDVIVNSTSENLKLTFGQCSRALLDAAGRDIQDECAEKYPKGVGKGDVAVTGPGRLKCKIICHGSLARYGDSLAEEMHMQFISNCLAELDRQGFSTIALPALTTGFLKFPRDLAARNACRAVEKYKDENPETTLKEVHFVIHHSDEETIQAFADAVKTLGLDQQEATEILRRVCSCKIGEISILVKAGIDEDEKAKFNMVVNFVGSASLDVTTRTKHVENDIHHLSLMTDGDMEIVYSKQFDKNKIYHTYVLQYRKNDPHFIRKDIGEAVFNCLTEANRAKISSIVFMLHKSKYNVPPKIVSNAIFGALNDFLSFQKTTMNLTVVVPETDGRYSEIAKAMRGECKKFQRASATPVILEFCRELSLKEPQLPEYWTTVTVRRTIKDVNKSWYTWLIEMKLNLYARLVDVDAATRQTIEKLVLSTWVPQMVGHGRDAEGLADLNYSSIKVLKVERLENICLYEKYSYFRAYLFQKAGRNGVFKQLSELSPSMINVLTSEIMGRDPVLRSDQYPEEANEHFLFHGTKTETYKNILLNGLDISMSDNKGMFGQGVYLAESPTKADQYTDHKDDRTKGEKKMFLVRSCLGRIHVARHPKPNLRRPPCFQSGCESDSCEHSGIQRCDSVVGDGTWIFREFVTYHHYQNYPEYLITYVRV